MKAIIWTAYGAPEVLKYQEAEKPVPGAHEVLVKNHVTTATTGDARLRGLRVPAGFRLPTRLAFGITKPGKQIPGMDFAGEVEAVGKQVSQFQPGDRVCGTTGMNMGANAEYVCIGEDKILTSIPATLSYENAVAGTFGGLTAIYFLRDRAQLQAGQKLLVNGAAGAVGTMAVQFGKYYQAEVTGVCSAANHDLVPAIGAGHVLDYHTEDFTANGQTYDVILDTVGNLSFAQCRQSLTPRGELILINADLLTILKSMFNRRLICGVSVENKADFKLLLELVNAGSIKPVIGRSYTLADIVAAHRYIDTGHKKGNVVLKV